MSSEYSSNRNNLESETSSLPRTGKWLGRGVRLLLGLFIVAAAAGTSIYWMTHQPTAQRRPPAPQATLVEVSPVHMQSEKVVVHAMGSVVPTKSIELASRVAGQIVEVSPRFIPGGHFKTGEKILQVEQKDYLFAVEQRKSELVQAQRDLKLEMGQQSVAQREYELLAKEVEEEDMELLLRQPQLEMAKAAVSAAQAALKKAQLDLERTAIVSPFNSVVQSKSVDLGSQISAGTMLASLVGTDVFWVEVSVPVDELKWIGIPGYNEEEGSDVRVYYESAWGMDAFRSGTVERLMTDLEPQGRMARLLISVHDPLQLQSDAGKRHPLILGSYVRVEIDGAEAPGVVNIPRTALREGNQVWVMSPDGKLDIRTVCLCWSGNDCVYVADGLGDGDLLITSGVAAPVQGMPLVATDSSSSSAEGRVENLPLPKAESQP